ncbi:MAG: DoxX family protein [Chitinophagaceae bacterium]|nr:DoxX family protein [Chitinophagaceae bacterium]
MTNKKPKVWSGRVISGLCILFLLVDAIMKIAKAAPSMQGSAQLGWPEGAVQGIGILLLTCTILYIIPRTAVLGAMLLTGYLGGAIAIMVRADAGGHPFFFPLVFGILVWVGLFMHNEKVYTLMLNTLKKEKS